MVLPAANGEPGGQSKLAKVFRHFCLITCHLNKILSGALQELGTPIFSLDYTFAKGGPGGQSESSKVLEHFLFYPSFSFVIQFFRWSLVLHVGLEVPSQDQLKWQAQSCSTTRSVFISNLNIVVLSGQSQELRTTRVSVDYTVAKEGPVCQVPKHLQ